MEQESLGRWSCGAAHLLLPPCHPPDSGPDRGLHHMEEECEGQCVCVCVRVCVCVCAHVCVYVFGCVCELNNASLPLPSPPLPSLYSNQTLSVSAPTLSLWMPLARHGCWKWSQPSKCMYVRTYVHTLAGCVVWSPPVTLWPRAFSVCGGRANWGK